MKTKLYIVIHEVPLEFSSVCAVFFNENKAKDFVLKEKLPEYDESRPYSEYYHIEQHTSNDELLGCKDEFTTEGRMIFEKK